MLGSVLLLIFVGLGGLVWLYTSGRLAPLAQGLIRDLSGQDVTFTAVEFTSWHTVALTQVHLRQQVSNGHVEAAMTLFCPRLEARYGLLGLLHKRVKTIRLHQPSITVHVTEASPPAADTSPTATSQAPLIPLLPFTRLTIAQGALQVHRHGTRHDLQQLDLDLRQHDTKSLHLDATGTLAAGVAIFRLRGQTSLDAPQPAGTWKLTLQKLPLAWLLQAAPTLVPSEWQLTHGALDATAEFVMHTPERLGGTLTLTAAELQAQTVGFSLQQGSLAAQARLEADMAQGTLDLHGTADITAQALRLGKQHDATALSIDALRGRLPFRATTTTITVSDADIHTQAWRRGPATAAPLLPAFAWRSTSTLDIPQQQLTLHQFEATLETLGRSTGSGTLAWGTQTVHDLHLLVTPTTATALWHSLAPLLPAASRAWGVAGHTQLKLHAPLLALRSQSMPQPLTLTWELQDMAFSSPTGEYAGEHITGILEAALTLEPATGQHTLRGTFTVQPFALLLGTLFPALEEQQVHPVVTFSATYQTRTEQLRLSLTSQMHPLGTLIVHGDVHQPMRTPRFDLQGVLQRIDLGQVWRTFVTAETATGPPTWTTTTVQGSLDAVLRLRGPATALDMRGALDAQAIHLRTPTVTLEGIVLQLPLQLHWPLSPIPPSPAALPTEAYGRLHIDRMRFKGFATPPLTMRLAMQEDTLIFPDTLTLPVLDGRLRLQHLVAQQLFRATRRITLQADVQELNLLRLQRSTTKLPLAGIVEGEFSHIDIHGDALDTDGALRLHLAGGVVQLTDVRGSAIFSSLPTLRCSLVTTKPLSLLRLTEIYPIGSMGGMLHFRVPDLVTTAWQPAAFRLTFRVRETQEERREITIRALNNLLFTTGSAKLEAGQAYRLPYKRFGAQITLHHDTLRLRGLYHDNANREYFMLAPTLGAGVSIINRVPHNGISFRDFLQRLKATVLDNPDVRVK